MLLCSFLIANDSLTIIYPKTSHDPLRDRFQLDLLRFILKKSNVKFRLIPYKHILTQARIIQELKRGTLDIYWMGTSKSLEKELIPIYYPIFRGLLGHRVFIIHKSNQAKFDQINSLEDLKSFIGAQGIGWSDIKILEDAGLHQRKARYENIFKMVQAKRVDYFSRAVTEAFIEVASRKQKYPDLVVEKHIELIYPFAMFFFVSPKSKWLSRTIRRGFQKAYEDSSFIQFFYNHPFIKKTLQQANLTKRVKISIPNPYLSSKTLHINKELWHQ